VRPVMAAARPHRRLPAVDDDAKPIAVPFDLMPPVRPLRGPIDQREQGSIQSGGAGSGAISAPAALRALAGFLAGFAGGMFRCKPVIERRGRI
jgi:hypothetical protein